MYGNKNIPRYYVFLTRFTEPLLTTVFELWRFEVRKKMSQSPMKHQWSVQALLMHDWFILNCLLVPTFSEPYLTTVFHFKHRGPVKQKGARPNGKPMKRTSSSMSWLVPAQLVIGSESKNSSQHKYWTLFNHCVPFQTQRSSKTKRGQAQWKTNEACWLQHVVIGSTSIGYWLWLRAGAKAQCAAIASAQWSPLAAAISARLNHLSYWL